MVPSPKFQFQDVIFPDAIDELSAKNTESFRQSIVKVKEATGEAFTFTTCSAVSVHPVVVVTTSSTESLPAAAYVCVGFCKVSVPPSPKLQLHETMVSPVTDDRSLNEMDCPVQIFELENAATGDLPTAILRVSVTAMHWPLPVEVRTSTTLAVSLLPGK